MNLQEFKNSANKTETNNNTGFGGIITEVLTLDTFKVEKKTYCYTDKSTQVFERFFYENEVIKESQFLSILLNYKI
jgi:hypothetical protein